MSTWASRLTSASPDSRNASAQNSPFIPTTVPPVHCRLSDDDFFALGGTSSSSMASPLTVAQQQQLLERQNAAATANACNPLLSSLPIDCWDWVTAFLSYNEVCQLACTCKLMWQRLRDRDSIWTQQLRFFHDDVMSMRGGALLTTEFAIPTDSSMPAYERFKRERRLYVLDAHREWHFREVSLLDDKPTGSFTVPLHLGKEVTESSAAAPLSRQGDGQSLPNSTTTMAVGGAGGRRLPPVGAPVLEESATPMRIRVFHPIRPTVVSPVSRVAAKNTVAQYQDAQAHFGGSDEDVLRYVMAVSEAEAQGLPPPPPLFSNSSPYANGGGFGGPRSGSSSLHNSPSPPPPTFVDADSSNRGSDLKPSELLTMMDFVSSGTINQSRIPITEVTAEEDEMFLLALGATLRGARQRRLHLGNHHRAVLNNGQTTRHRRGRVPQGQRTDRAADGSIATDAAAMSSSNSPLEMAASASHLPLPVNQMLRNFSGLLMEITKREAHQICCLMGHPDILDHFVIFHSYGSSNQRRAGEATAQTRFFLAPQLSVGGKIGFIAVDVVRVLIVVEKEQTSVDNPVWSQPMRFDPGGRTSYAGRGYNAQFFNRGAIE